jgi:transposase
MNKGSERDMSVIGIDVSKAKLDCAWLTANNQVKSNVFTHQLSGWQDLINWATHNTGNEISELQFVMEATGIYHENVANWLYDSGAKISIVNPAHVKYYAQSLGGGGTKNDKKDSVILARYGVKEQPSFWQPAPQEIRVLKALLTRLDAVEKDLQRERNRQEKTLVSDTPATILASIKHMIDPHETERKTREKLIDGHIKAHKQLKENRTLLESIPSVGKVISQRMLMLLGAYQFEDAHQCAAYLRLIPVQKESGSSLKGRSKLAKNGNKTIRAKLYMATVTATCYNPDVKAPL